MVLNEKAQVVRIRMPAYSGTLKHLIRPVEAEQMEEEAIRSRKKKRWQNDCGVGDNEVSENPPWVPLYRPTYQYISLAKCYGGERMVTMGGSMRAREGARKMEVRSKGARGVL